MSRRLRTYQKNTRIQTQELSAAPAQGMFPTRPFEKPEPTADSYQQPDLKTSLIQAERYGHHLGQMHDTDVSAPQVTQLKMGTGQFMQPEPAAPLLSKRVQPSSGGRPLPKNVRQKMEGAFSTDFSNVSVHEGAEAESIGAVAYTQGSQIHFQPGKYNPMSQSGQQLLGHELTHVVQQRAGQVAVPQGKGTPINSDPKLEQEADVLGAKATQGEQVQVAGAGSGIQRQATSQLGHNFEPAVQLSPAKRKRDPSSTNETPAKRSRPASPEPESQPAASQSRSSSLGPEPASKGRHRLSDGDSDSGDSNIVYRATRPDEKPLEEGLRPPAGHNPNKTVSQHVTSGTKAAEKSDLVSTTKSKRTAGAYASESKGSQVVKANLSEAQQEGGEKRVYDLTDEQEQKANFPQGGTGLNFAKSSKEVLIKGGLGPEAVESVRDADTTTVKKYEDIKNQRAQGEPASHKGQNVSDAFRTRKKKSENNPKPRVLLDPKNDEEGQ